MVTICTTCFDGDVLSVYSTQRRFYNSHQRSRLFSWAELPVTLRVCEILGINSLCVTETNKTGFERSVQFNMCQPSAVCGADCFLAVCMLHITIEHLQNGTQMFTFWWSRVRGRVFLSSRPDAKCVSSASCMYCAEKSILLYTIKNLYYAENNCYFTWFTSGACTW
jgi:hypothetical protein